MTASAVPFNPLGRAFSDDSPGVLRVVNWIMYRAGMTVHNDFLTLLSQTLIIHHKMPSRQSGAVCQFLNSWLLGLEFGFCR